jgi:hypothetical protein
MPLLPSEKTPAKTDISDFTILLHARQKFGKTTFCAQAPGALFLATEPGLKGLDAYQVPVTSWEVFLDACAEIAEGKHAFRTIVIDTVDLLFKQCSEFICRKLKVEHEADLAYGKGYAMIGNEFYRVISKLGHLPYGLILTSHSREMEVEGRTGKYTRIVPTLPEKARKTILGMTDFILYGDFEPTTGSNGEATFRRVIRTKPSIHYEAGDRTGRMPEAIDFEWQAFEKAFRDATAAGAGAQTTTPTPQIAPPPSRPSPSRVAR